ncbi:MAG: ankyrin repeat domain-containing protein [Acidobacteriota bacterium]
MTTIFDAIDRNDLGSVWTLVQRHEGLREVDAETGLTPLALAAEMGQAEIVRILLQEGEVDPNHGGATTPLEAAVLEGDPEIVDLLLRFGADVNQAVDEGFTPLMTAATTGAQRIARRLLEAGARPRARNDEGKTAIDLATDEGFDDLARELRSFSRKRFEAERADRADRVAREQEERAARRRARAEQRLSGQPEAEPESADRSATGTLIASPPTADSAPGDAGETAPRLEAFELPPEATPDLAELEGIDRFSALLEHGAFEIAAALAADEAFELEERDEAGRTALMIAAAAGALEVVEVLLDVGAVVDATEDDETDETALVKAVNHPTPARAAIVRRLAEHGAFLDRRHGRTGMTPLMYAATADVYLDAAQNPLDFAPMTRLLIELGADLEAEDLRGNTVWRLVKRNALGALTSSPSRRRLFQLLRVLEHHGARQIASQDV